MEAIYSENTNKAAECPQRSKINFFDQRNLRLQIISCILFILCSFSLYAQGDNHFKLKIEAGLLWDWVDGDIYLSGPFLYIEPQLKTSKNTAIGLRIGAAHNTQRVQTSDAEQFYIDNYTDRGNAAFSFAPTFNYYFRKKQLGPYIGVGLGYYFLTSSKDIFLTRNHIPEALEASVDNQIGLLLRSGLHLRNFIVGKMDLSQMTIGVEFNYLPKADVKIVGGDGQKAGTLDASNIALALGYTFGNRSRNN